MKEHIELQKSMTTSKNRTLDKNEKKMTCMGSETLNEIATEVREEKKT